MVKDEYLTKLRELIRAEINAYAESVEEDESGYHKYSNKEEKNAERVFQELLREIEIERLLPCRLLNELDDSLSEKHDCP